jgi:hypothetical protein
MHNADWDLKGPRNDVRDVQKTLLRRFGFASRDIHVLEGLDNKDTAPTRANILRALEEIETKTANGSAIVFIYVSGHGIRVPIPESQEDVLDPKNPEPDGFDEAFAAADFRYGTTGAEGLILDDEWGRHLEALRDAGAHVWVVFDACHSGSMAKGAPREQSRQIDVSDPKAGVPKTAIERAHQLAAKRKTKDPVEETAVDVRRKSGNGSLIAFYAAQAGESAPDLPCPANASSAPENWHGFFTYTILTALEQQPAGQPLTYQDLGNIIGNRFRAERGIQGPSPFWSGDSKLPVLAMTRWPSRPAITIESGEKGFRIDAGQLQGLAVGTVLAVQPAGSSTESNPLGYVKVIDARLDSASEEPVEFGGSK